VTAPAVNRKIVRVMERESKCDQDLES